MDVDSHSRPEMKRFVPEGALAYKRAGAKGARWIFDEWDLTTTRKESPELVVVLGSRTTRAELVAGLVSLGSESDREGRVELAEALIRGRTLPEVFEIARLLKLADETRAWLASECDKLKLRAEVSGLLWLRSRWLEVDSEEEGLERASQYESVNRCSFFRGDVLVARYRLYVEVTCEWRREEEPAVGASGT